MPKAISGLLVGFLLAEAAEAYEAGADCCGALEGGATLLDAVELICGFLDVFSYVKESAITLWMCAPVAGYVKSKMGGRERFSGDRRTFHETLAFDSSTSWGARMSNPDKLCAGAEVKVEGVTGSSPTEK